MKYRKQLESLRGAPHVSGAFLAGGAVLSAFAELPINDYDIYFKSERAFVDAVFNAYDDGLWCVSATDRAVTFADGGYVMQFMRFDFFESAEKIFESFDFTCCMAAVDLDKWNRLGTLAGRKDNPDPLIMHDDFLPSAAAKRLTFNNGTRFPIASAMRIVKYQERGFKIDKQNMLAVALACAGVNIDSWETLKQQIGGIYGDRIVVSETGAFSLREVTDSVSAEGLGNARVPEDELAVLGSAESLLKHLGIAIPEEYADRY